MIAVIFCLFLIPFVLAQDQSFFKKVLGKINGKYSDQGPDYRMENPEDKMGGLPEKDFGKNDDEGMKGPSDEEMECMQSCVAIGCEGRDKDCMVANSKDCGLKCNVDVSGPPEPKDKGEACMQKCIIKRCDDFDISCQEKNMNSCEDECNMKGDAPDESEMDEEQKCISECVSEKDSELKCGNSKEGETGNKICKKCAKKCEYLYEGPCLNDKQIKEKDKECKTCKHCYGEPLEGPSGEGWGCIIDVECKDASSEFGDEPGEGPGIGQEGYVNKEPLGERIGNFFKGLFGGKNKEDKTAEETPLELEQVTE